MSIQETCEFSTFANWQSFFNLLQLFILTKSLTDATNKTYPICPTLISFQLQGVDIQPRMIVENQTWEKKFLSVKSRIKSCLLRGHWLQETVTNMELGRWLCLWFAAGLCGRQLFVYWFSLMCWSYFHLPVVPRCYSDRSIGNDSFVRVPWGM
jgi:hypothetical protein